MSLVGDVFQDGDVVKMEAVLDRRHQVAFSLEVRDAATGDTALLWAAKRGHNTVSVMDCQEGHNT